LPAAPGGPAATPTTAPAAGAAKTTPASKTVSISFTSQGTPAELTMFETIIAAFEKATPAVKVERKFDPSLTWEKVHTMLGAGTAASVMRSNDDDIFLLLAQGSITGLDDFIAKDLKREDYYPYVFTKRIGPGGEVGAATIGTSPWVLFYNTKHFEEAGLTPATDWDKAWDFKTMDAALDKLAKKDASGKITRYAFYYMDATPQFHMGNFAARSPTTSARPSAPSTTRTRCARCAGCRTSPASARSACPPVRMPCSSSTRGCSHHDVRRGDRRADQAGRSVGRHAHALRRRPGGQGQEHDRRRRALLRPFPPARRRRKRPGN